MKTIGMIGGLAWPSTVTFYRVINEEIISHTDLPCIHIVDPVGEYAAQNGYHKVGLMGSNYTMDGAFFKGRLQEKYNLEVLIPQGISKTNIHNALYRELTKGVIREETHEEFVQCIRELTDCGAEVIVLGCTEFGLIVKGEDSPVPILDTTITLAKAAVERALEE